MKIYWNKKVTILFFIVAVVVRILLAPLVWHPDVRNHVDWGERFWEYGANEFYTANVWDYTWPNQPPGTMYMFALSKKVFEGLWSVLWWMNTTIPAFPSIIISYSELNLYPAIVKLPAIFADLGLAWLIYKVLSDFRATISLKKKFRHAELVSASRSMFQGIPKPSFAQLRLGKRVQDDVAIWGFVLFLFNPVVIYNSSVWGQYDSVINFFALLSFHQLIKKRLTLSVILFALSLYIKLSLLIFLPIFVMIALRQKYPILIYAKSILITIFFIGIITLPFSCCESFSWLFYLYKDKVLGQQLHVITANAFNFWGATTGLEEVSNATKFGPLSYEWWGNILFALSYVPTLVMVYKKQDMKSVMISLSLAAFSSFMLLTNMHERYLYPLFAPFTIVAVVSGELWLYMIVSLISLLNMYNLWWVPRFENIVDLFTVNGKLAPRIISLIMTICFLYYYKKAIIQPKKL